MAPWEIDTFISMSTVVDLIRFIAVKLLLYVIGDSDNIVLLSMPFECPWIK